jgi:hypothetical protein
MVSLKPLYIDLTTSMLQLMKKFQVTSFSFCFFSIKLFVQQDMQKVEVRAR